MQSTKHKIIFCNSNNLQSIKNESVNLMVTSPPYPMIEMWDELFSEQNEKIRDALKSNDGLSAFELMNQELDKAWNEVYRVLKKGGIACINIGDATRTLNNDFQLYVSHARILNHCIKIGFQALPEILWRKQTNTPNKFMGSGMMPPGAYVTLEHEHILILRKGSKREFKSNEKENRKESSYFWEERNAWFSDLWEDLKGTGQKLNDKRTRDRSAAYPFELAYRLINMFSVKGDVVLDPYLGTGTTTIASMVSGRNSIGVEINPLFKDTINNRTKEIVSFGNKRIQERIKKHLTFVEEREIAKGNLKHTNSKHKFKTMTKEESKTILNFLKEIQKTNENEYTVTYDQEVSNR